MSRKEYTVPKGDLWGHLRQAEKVGEETEGNRRSSHVHDHQKSYNHLVCMYVSIAPPLFLLIYSATRLYDILPSSDVLVFYFVHTFISPESKMHQHSKTKHVVIIYMIHASVANYVVAFSAEHYVHRHIYAAIVNIWIFILWSRGF